MTVLSLAAALWWGLALAILIGSAVLALAQPRLARRRERPGEAQPLSVLIPLHRADAGLDRATASVPLGGEVLLSAPDAAEAALRIAAEALASAGAARVETFVAPPRPGINPKAANLFEPIAAAVHERLLIKDANTVLPAGAAAAMMRAMAPGIGLVCAVPVARAPQGFAATVEAALINGYGARLLLALGALGGGVGIGAAMLARKADLLRAGGLAAMAGSVADDQALARAMAGIGLGTRFAAATVDQDLGRRPAGTVWARHLRWALCRRLEAPAAFVAEPLIGAPAACLAGALAAPVLAVSPGAMAAFTIAAWVAAETALTALKRWPLPPLLPIAILARETLMPVLWIAALLARRVRWGDAPVTGKGGAAAGLGR